MKKLFCSKCGREIQEQDVLGIGLFDKSIGKYAGLTVVTFICSSCHQKEYQVVNRNPFTTVSEIMVHPELTSEEMMIAQREASITGNDQLDFHEKVDQIDSIEQFVVKCNQERFEKTTYVGQIVKTPTEIFNLFNKYNGNDKKRMMIFFVDDEHKLITWELFGEGTNRRITFDPKVIFRSAMLLPQRVSVVLAHNHLTPLTTPSKKDILRTKRLVKAGEILGIDFADHVLIDQYGFKSFSQLNLL